jgi:pre-rRNA-processing protein TSR4
MSSISDLAGPPVHLGFAEPLGEDSHPIAHESPNWNDWDGGQIGGLVSWLDPQNIPKRPLECIRCASPLLFVCQLYAPADSVNPEAFHRTLYVFCCPQCCASDSVQTTDCFRILRGQLPKGNQYYPQDIALIEGWAKHTPGHWNIDICAVCGQRSRGKCPKQGLPFCGPHHQKEHLRLHRKNGENGESDAVSSIFYKSELVVEEEPPAYEHGEIDGAPETMFSSEDDNDSDEDLTQDDLNAMTGANNRLSQSNNSDDPLTNAFRSRVNDRPNVQEQVVRYQQWPPQEGPLWIRSDHVPIDNVPPPCQYCGAPRKFEFQLMPQLLHYLWNKSTDRKSEALLTAEAKQALLAASEVDVSAAPNDFEQARQKALRHVQSRLLHCDRQVDWGVVAVYTCTESCGRGDANDGDMGSYREEYAWRQPPLG